MMLGDRKGAVLGVRVGAEAKASGKAVWKSLLGVCKGSVQPVNRGIAEEQ